jgi:hypothetical protein
MTTSKTWWVAELRRCFRCEFRAASRSVSYERRVALTRRHDSNNPFSANQTVPAFRMRGMVVMRTGANTTTSTSRHFHSCSGPTTATLTVADETGQVGSASQQLTVPGGPPSCT